MTTQQQTTSEQLRKARALAAILEHAEKAGLPAPHVVGYDRHAPISLGFETLEHLTEWSRWMESPITEKQLSKGEGVIYRAAGTALEEPIGTWVVRLKAAR